MKSKYWVLIIVCMCSVLVDQWTKHIIQQKLFLYQKVEVISGFFNLVHIRNTGGAFGIFGGEKGGFGSLIFVVVSLMAIACILFLYLRLQENDKILSLSFSLVLGGAMGNLIDRLLHGEVIDFLDFYLYSFHWPAFNIADSAISIGVGLMAIVLVFHKRTTKLQKRSQC